MYISFYSNDDGDDATDENGDGATDDDVNEDGDGDGATVRWCDGR